MLTAKRIQELLKKATANMEITVSVVSIRGQILASNNDKLIGKVCTDVLNMSFNKNDEMVVYNGSVFKKVFPGKNKSIYVIVEGYSISEKNYACLVSYLIESEWKSNLQKMDKEQIFRKIILQQIKPIEVYGYIKDFNIEENLKRSVLMVEVNGKSKGDTSIVEILRNAFPKNSNDIVVQLNDDIAVLIKALEEESLDNESITEFAQAIQDTIMTETYLDAKIGIGTVIDDIKDLHRSFEEAKKALDLGTIFVSHESIFIYDLMSLERLLYGTSIEECITFYNEVFAQDKDRLINEEMYLTIEKFFQNNLNLSETSRQLYIHRNTLVYRLDKIQKITGLDLRNFDDAVTFKITMMIGRYIKNKT